MSTRSSPAVQPWAIAAQRFVMRANDDLPSFAAVIEYEDGTPFNMDYPDIEFHVYLSIIDERTGLNVVPGDRECIIASPADGLIQYDWTAAHTEAWGPGVYDLFVTVSALGDDLLTVSAPSDRSVEYIIRPNDWEGHLTGP